jgi:hypothetical protein
VIPLGDALVQAKNRLGSFELAAHDITQAALTGRLTLAIRWVQSDGTARAAILRRTFWRRYEIKGRLFDASRKVPGIHRRSDGRRLLGRLWFFVLRRRFDCLYGAERPSREKMPEVGSRVTPEEARETEIQATIERAVAVLRKGNVSQPALYDAVIGEPARWDMAGGRPTDRSDTWARIQKEARARTGKPAQRGGARHGPRERRLRS